MEANSINNNLCLKHNKVLEFLCYDCNLLLCYRCNNDHLKSNLGHNCDHIDDIKSSLSKSLECDDEKSSDSSSDQQQKQKEEENNFIKSKIEIIWLKIKESTSIFDSLEFQNKEISRYFQQLHDFLIVEEHKLKKPIFKDIDQFKSEINLSLNELKSLVDIINISSISGNSSNNSKKINDQQDSLNIEENEYGYSDDEYEEEEEELIDSYSTETIVSLVKESNSFNEFISNSSNTFCKKNKKTTENDDNIDSLILDLIIKYNNEYVKNISNDSDNIDSSASTNNIKIKNHDNPSFIEYKVTIDHNLFNNIKQMIPQCIKINTKEKVRESTIKLQQQMASAASNQKNISNNNKQVQLYRPYLFSTFYDNNSVKGATLIDLTSNIAEFVDYDFSKSHTFNSSVSIGEHVFIFGGINSALEKQGNCSYIRFSVRSRAIDHRGEIEVDGGHSISACYDGREYIYLLNGFSNVKSEYLHRIDRFNVKSMQFDRFCDFFDLGDNHCHTFFFNDALYILASNRPLITFDPTCKKIVDRAAGVRLQHVRAACTDGRGTVYIYTADRGFIKLNLETKKIDNLASIQNRVNMNVSIVYHSNSQIQSLEQQDQQGFIYLMGGSLFGNHLYSIKDNTWSEFLHNDKYQRTNTCSNVIYLNK